MRALLLSILVAGVAHADTSATAPAAPSAPLAEWQVRCAKRFARARAELAARAPELASITVRVEPFPLDSEVPSSGAPSVYFGQWVSHGDTILAAVWDRGAAGETTAWHAPKPPVTSRQLELVRERGRFGAYLSMSFGIGNTRRQLEAFRKAFQPAIDDCLKLE